MQHILHARHLAALAEDADDSDEGDTLLNDMFAVRNFPLEFANAPATPPTNRIGASDDLGEFGAFATRTFRPGSVIASIPRAAKASRRWRRGCGAAWRPPS